MKSKMWSRFGILLILISLIGCSAPVPTLKPNLEAHPPDAQTLWVMPSTTPEMPQSAMPSATSTPMKSSTATRTPIALTPRSTPRTTLSAVEGKEKILDLIQNYEGCSLPCLWSLTPGETSLQTLRDFTAQFRDIQATDEIEIEVNEYNDGGSISLVYKKNSIAIINSLGYNINDKTGIELIALYSYSMEDLGPNPTNQLPTYAPIWGDPAFNQEMSEYLLPSILTNYGEPSQVLLATWRDEPDGEHVDWYPFSLVLLYLDKRIFVEYELPREKAGNSFRGCPSQTHITLAVWPPESELKPGYIGEKAGSLMTEGTIDYFRTVEEATSMTLDEFYQKFKDPQNTACIETPQELWLP